MTSLVESKTRQRTIGDYFGGRKRRRLATSLEARSVVLQNSQLMLRLLEYLGAAELICLGGYRVSKLVLKLLRSQKSIWRSLWFTGSWSGNRIVKVLRFSARFEVELMRLPLLA